MENEASEENPRLTNLWPRIEPLLTSIERPSRYIGSEWVAGKASQGALPGDLCFCMAYPDTYELGQPNQALRILINCVNATDGLYAERAFLPAKDMLEVLRREKIPAFSLESCAPLCEFDVVGITLPHELCATNVLEMLDASNISILSKDRAESDPIVIAGGPCACNPEPFAPFFDVISIGEGEESVPEILLAVKDMRSRGVSRKEILHNLANIPGTYVPSLYEQLSKEEALACGCWVKPIYSDVPEVVTKRVYEKFSSSSAWEPLQVPYMEIVHDRLNVEILRGCARGCRFCQAGMMYRPVRERSADNIVESVLEGLCESGYEEVSLTSLSSTDHSQIEEILTRLNRELNAEGVRVSVPSQRLDSFGVDMAALVAGRKRGGLTFAPEAGTQRLRDVINKNVTDDDLMAAAGAAVKAGWRRMKLYFMIGLPTECDDDLVGIADMCNRTLEHMRQAAGPDQRGSISVNVSVNVFVPKAQTPFQWEGQISSEEAARRVKVIKSALSYKAITLSYHEPKTSLIESVMSRGSREVASVVELAWRKGASFDAWSEHFNADAWAEAASECKVDLDEISQTTYDSAYPMPWSHISFGIDDAFLKEERKRAYETKTTPDCTFESCSMCGACPGLSTKNNLAAKRHSNGNTTSEGSSESNTIEIEGVTHE